jgi:ribosome-associated protein
MAKIPAKKTAKKTAKAVKTTEKGSAKETGKAVATPIKKTPAKKTTAPKKAAAKKVAAKKVPAKKVAAKKVAAKKVSTSKPAGSKIDIKIMDAGQLLAITVAQGMFEKKAENIRILDMRKIAGASADYFVLSHAASDKQVEAIAKSVEEEVKKKLNENPMHREGFENLEWILIDYFNVVAHIFQEEKREFYGIEQLWGDAEEIVFKGK